MTRDPLLRAWAWLVALSIGSTIVALTVTRLQVTVAGVVILTLAWLKARVILARYLGLAGVPAIAFGFGLVLGLFMLACLALYLAG